MPIVIMIMIIGMIIRMRTGINIIGLIMRTTTKQHNGRHIIEETIEFSSFRIITLKWIINVIPTKRLQHPVIRGMTRSDHSREIQALRVRPGGVRWVGFCAVSPVTKQRRRVTLLATKMGPHQHNGENMINRAPKFETQFAWGVIMATFSF